MSLDPWAALEAQRRRRHWRSWPWGWVALALGLLTWAAFGYAVLLGAAGMRMPGDGAAPRTGRPRCSRLPSARPS